MLPKREERGIGVVLGGVSDSGILAKGPVPGAAVQLRLARKGMVVRAARIDETCRRHGVALAAALQFAYAHPAVTNICIGAPEPAQQPSNARHAETAIPQDLWKDLRAQGFIRQDAPTPKD